MNKKRKAILDDGCCPELVSGAEFDGIFEIPIIKKPEKIIIPKMIVPFSERNKVKDRKQAIIGFYEMGVISKGALYIIKHLLFCVLPSCIKKWRIGHV